MTSTLIDLCDLISSSVRTVDARCQALSRAYPDLNNPANTAEDEKLLEDEQIARATSVAVAAASQIIASMQYPSWSLLDTSLGVNLD
jgi:hypothetical protein